MPSILDAGSRGAAEISQLFWLVTGIATVVFVLVEGLLLYSILRFRNRPASEAVQTHGNTKLELAWTIMPAIILVVLLGFTLRSMANVRTPQPGTPLEVKVIGHQWWWEFQYPEYNIKTANQLWVPIDRPINIELQSVDVQHGFWAPQLFGKMDAVPGHLNKMSFFVTEPGEYGAQCTQMCGEQHAQMRFSVIAVSASEFSTWALAQSAEAPAPSDEAAVRGQEVFIEKCAACHTVAGTAAAGAVGPNLTHLQSRDFIAGGILALTDENLRLWIQDTQAVKVGAIMPSFKCNPDGSNASACITPEAVNDVVAYLKTLK
jgi:cytochrome c oxidase subunit 2